MVVSLSKELKVRFYGSPDLKKWELLSEFGPAGATGDDVIWECPDLFELPVVNQAGHKRCRQYRFSCLSLGGRPFGIVT